MIRIDRLLARLRAAPEGVHDPKRLIQFAESENGRQYCAKNCSWPNRESRVPVRLANEFTYYAIATRNDLLMPAGVVLEIDRELYWGSEFKEGRLSLGQFGADLTDAQLREIQEMIRCSASLRRHFLLSRLLDIALLTSDRTPWNILKSSYGDSVQLWYFDHDRSLGWKGGSDPAANRMRAPEAELADIASCRGHSQIAAFSRGTDIKDECFSLFSGLKLEAHTLDEILAQVPANWIAGDDFKARLESLRKWWLLLRDKFETSVYPVIFPFN